MKLSNKKINLILGLCLVSLISIGFSSWTIGEGGLIDNPSGGIIVDDVEYYADYIRLKDDIEVFKYYNNGFLHDSYFVGDEGHIIAKYEMNISNCKNKFAGNSTLEVELSLKYSNDVNTSFNIFLDSEVHSSGYHLLTSQVICSDYPSIIVGESYGQTNKKYITPITFTNILLSDLTSIEFTIDYTFFATHGDYFKNNIFNHLNDIDFVIGISIEGK